MADTRSETRKRFDAEFLAARKRGDKTFDFDGRKIAVKLADDGLKIPKLSNVGQTMPTTATGQAPLRNIPQLSNAGQTVPIGTNRSLVTPEEGATAYVPRSGAVPTSDSLAEGEEAMRRGGKVKHKVKHKAYAKGGSIGRGDGCAIRGHTKGTMR